MAGGAARVAPTRKRKPRGDGGGLSAGRDGAAGRAPGGARAGGGVAAAGAAGAAGGARRRRRRAGREAAGRPALHPGGSAGADRGPPRPLREGRAAGEGRGRPAQRSRRPRGPPRPRRLRGRRAHPDEAALQNAPQAHHPQRGQEGLRRAQSSVWPGGLRAHRGRLCPKAAVCFCFQPGNYERREMYLFSAEMGWL